MSQETSRMYEQGAADAREDDEIITRCPPGDPLGPRPPFPNWPEMYNRGYEDTYIGDPHVCTSQCKEAKWEPLGR